MAETEISNIMKKYKKTGMVNFVNNNQAEYMEAPEIDFHQAMNVIAQANEMFDQMPSELRKKFNNDPGNFMDFVHDKNNEAEMYDLGLAQRPPDYVPPATEAPAEPTPETPES